MLTVDGNSRKLGLTLVCSPIVAKKKVKNMNKEDGGPEQKQKGASKLGFWVFCFGC